MTEFNFSLSQEIWREQAAYDAELSKWVNIYNSFVDIICSSLERRRKDSFFRVYLNSIITAKCTKIDLTV